MLELMEHNKQVLVSKLKNQAHYIKINGKPIGTGYEKDIQGLVDRVGSIDEQPQAPAPKAEKYKVGEIVKGYEFLGGDWKDKKNWKKAQQ